MAFNPANFELLAGGGKTVTLWGYKTTDTGAQVDTAGYFNAMAGQLQVGDRIIASVNTGATIAFGQFVVNANDGSTVDVADLDAAGGTDTD